MAAEIAGPSRHKKHQHPILPNRPEVLDNPASLGGVSLGQKAPLYEPLNPPTAALSRATHFLGLHIRKVEFRAESAIVFAIHHVSRTIKAKPSAGNFADQEHIFRNQMLN